MDIVSKYTALLGQQKLKESFVKDLELVLSRKDPNMEKGKLNFIRYSEMKNWSVRELFGEDLEQADRVLINKVYYMLFDIGSDFESVIRMLYSFRNGPKSGIKVADPEDNYEWTNKDGNEKVCAFQKEGEKVWIEFIESEFGKPKEILRSFDFTVTKMAYYKEPKYEEKEDDYFPFSSASIVAYEYKLLYHEKFFEHLHMKRLVIDENIPFPVSTWERSYRYKGYGYNMCRETKKKLLQAIKGVNVEEEDVSLYTTGGWD